MVTSLQGESPLTKLEDLLKMTANVDKLDEEFFYDFRETKRAYKIFAGSSMTTQKTISRRLELYRVFIFIFLVSMISMFIRTALIATEYLDEFAEAFHYGMVLLTMTLYLINERLARKDIDKTYQILKRCFYTYNGELNEEQKGIKRTVIKDIKYLTKLFSWMVIFACIVYIILTPLKDFLYPHLERKRSKTINNNLPIPFYIPFDDSYGIAVICVFFIECVCNIMVHSLITSIHEAYVGINGLIYGELKLLNYSIQHLEERAMKLYAEREASNLYRLEGSYHFTSYQECLKECLKVDLYHHMELLRCINLVGPFTGRVITLIYTLCSVIWAVGGYVMIRMIQQGVHAIDKVMEFGLILVAEGVFVFDMCRSNEKINSECYDLFMEIYSTRWYNYDKPLCGNILFMLMHTRKPPQLNRNQFNVSASFEIYLSLLSAAFSYINLLMFPLIFRALSRYAPYITLPVAALVGVIGYNMESILSDKYTPSDKSITQKRNERLLQNEETTVDLKEKNSIMSGVLDRNLSPSLQ